IYLYTYFFEKCNLPDADIALFKEVGIHITALDLFAGTFISFTIVVILTKFFGKNKSFKEALPLLPWTLLIGAVYTLSALLYAWLFGPEFISILGAMTGL